ncbi:hypothetical protein [Colwellia sp. PAMC 21821]|uniref:hypothetical protein n=1 Tax=Colwellia sp. PAMC 21821 TaxID=1816219 RepID=UPI0009C011BC|nr:hypothetical protein [Colwellia sp. PAMC 21821]ARD43767.1 hypothetical protein A3Q33_05265 [Colwellia sp. PAMC 21821]
MCINLLVMAGAMLSIFNDVLLINQKDSGMNNISLKKLSITVVLASLASNLVFAHNDNNKKLSNEVVPASSFSQLVTDYDTDDNNTLSAAELAENDKLTKAFNLIDINDDKEINEKEFNQYLANIKKSLL